MIRAGLYAPGSDPRLDEAVKLYPQLDDFVTRRSESVQQSFMELADALRVPARTRAGVRSA